MFYGIETINYKKALYGYSSSVQKILLENYLSTGEKLEDYILNQIDHISILAYKNSDKVEYLAKKLIRNDEKLATIFRGRKVKLLKEFILNYIAIQNNMYILETELQRIPQDIYILIDSIERSYRINMCSVLYTYGLEGGFSWRPKGEYAEYEGILSLFDRDENFDWIDCISYEWWNDKDAFGIYNVLNRLNKVTMITDFQAVKSATTVLFALILKDTLNIGNEMWEKYLEHYAMEKSVDKEKLLFGKKDIMRKCWKTETLNNNNEETNMSDITINENDEIKEEKSFNIIDQFFGTDEDDEEEVVTKPKHKKKNYSGTYKPRVQIKNLDAVNDDMSFEEMLNLTM